ncbi:acidic leucine-rich nuclear phosphoprotein 32 family member A [Tanacetum coccineum]
MWMTWHSTGKSKENGQMNHLVDGKARNFFDIIHSEFAKDPRNIRLGLDADGFNPFGNLSQTYNMWPAIMTTYITPPWMCMKETSFMLTMLIPGPKSPVKDIDVFLQPLIKELQTLWSGAILGGPVYMRWMYPFERYMKKLKNYVRNKAKPEGSIAEGYVAEEALTFCSHYLKGVETRFNRPDRNGFGLNPTDTFQVFQSICEPVGKEVYTTMDTKVMQKVVWFILNNSPEIDAYIDAYKKPESNANSYAACVVNELTYIGNRKVVLFRCKWFDTKNPPFARSDRSKRSYIKQGINHILTDKDSFRDQQYILATHARQVFYLEDPARRPPHWKVVEDVHHRKIWHRDVVEDEQDVIHDSNSSDVVLSAELGNLEYTILSTNDESTEVDALPDNEVADEEGADFIGDEDDVVPHMACVAPRSHGGDAGGDPPDDRRPKMLPHQCEGSGKRRESKHKALKKAFKQNGYRKLEIVFEANDQKTFKPVGQYGANFSSYVGELIKEIPQHYDSWENVPPTDKAPLIPRLQTYFDLQPHLNDETVIKINGEDKTMGSLARQEKPPKWKAGDAQWQKLVDFRSDPDRMKQSERNVANRAKNKVTTHQGSKSFAQGRHEFFEENQRYEGLIDHWRRRHSDKDGNFRTRENETLYAEMKAIQDAITAGTIPPKTDREILAEVTRSINRAHIAGVDLKRQHALEKEEQRKAFESQQNALKKFVDFFNRQQGTPSSQFQIPDLYTPQVFPGSIYTPGGPSSNFPAPSFTPLGLANCYTPTFDPETSQSGEQEDDNDSDEWYCWSKMLNYD